MTRTAPKTFVSKIARIMSAVSSAAPNTPPSAFRTSMPALLTRTSSPPSASMAFAAAATDASSVTSSKTIRAPSRPAARCPRSASRLPT